MKKIHRVVALILAALMAIGLMTTAFAATDSSPTIDPGKKASLSVYKYDITKASNDGAWDAESYVSTGLHDDTVIDKLSKYAIQGVEFTYLRVADIAMNSELVDGQRRVGGGHGKHVVRLADRGFLTVKFFAIPAGDAACLVRLEGGVRDIFLAEHNVRFGCRFVQRLPFRLGIRNIVEAIRNIVGRAIILVETTAPLQDSGRFSGGGGCLGNWAVFRVDRSILD